MKRNVLLVVAATLFTNCWNEAEVLNECVAVGRCAPDDAGAAKRDAGTDAGRTDSGTVDSGEPVGPDASIPEDSGTPDSGSVDAGNGDAGSGDAGAADSGSTDSGSTDSGSTDAGPTDAGPTDAGAADAGVQDAGPDIRWSLRSSGNSLDQLHNGALAAQGDTLIWVGHSASTDLSLGPISQPCPETCNYDAIISAWSRTGTPLWSRRLGGENNDIFKTLAVAPDGRIAVVGTFSGTANFGLGPLFTPSITDGVVVLFDPTGLPIWNVALPAVELDNNLNTATQGATAVAFHLSGDVLVGGTYRGYRQEGHIDRLAGADGGVTRFATLPDNYSSTPFGEFVTVDALGVTATGDVMVLGTFSATGAVFGSQTLQSTMRDSYLARLHGADGGIDGGIEWVTQITGVNNQDATALLMLPNDDVVIALRSVDGARVADAGSPFSSPRGEGDIAVARFNGATGSLVWSHQGGGTEDDIPWALALDRRGNILVAGRLQGVTGQVATFGGLTVDAGPSLHSEAFVLTLSVDAGLPLAISTLGSTSGSDSIFGIATSASGDLFVAGTADQPLSLGDDAGVSGKAGNLGTWWGNLGRW